MPDKGPSQIARVAAVGGLIAAFILVIIVIATSGGGDSGGGEKTTIPGASTEGPDTSSHKVQKALQNGKWKVEEGDTLTSIADDTGVDEDTLITLNPDIDPQALQPGQHVKLK
jgi:LysM repeat protein